MKNLFFLNRLGFNPDLTTRQSRVDSVSIASRLCLASLICLCMLTIGSGNVWGADITINASDVSGWNGTRGSQSGTASGFTITTTDGIYSTQLRSYASATFGISSSVGNITKIVFTYSQGGFTSASTGSISSGTWTSTGATSITFSSLSQVRVTKMVITTASSYSVVWTINPAAGGTLSATSGTSTTVTPNAAYTYGSPAYTVTTGSATVSQSTNTFTATPSANCTIRINMVEKPKYTVTLMDDNDTRTQATAGASVTLPSRTGCTGYTFAGWTKSWATAQTTWTTTAPTIIPAGSYTPSANENLYPVYTKTEGGGTAWSLCSTAASVTAGTYVITWDNSYYLPSETTASSNPAVGSGITVSNDNLSNTVTSAMQWTFTGNNTDGYSISHVSGNNTYKLSATNAAQGISVTTGSTSITWTVSVDNTYGMLLHGSDGGSRYLAVYNSGSWRYYATGNSYLGTLRLYKQTTASTTSYISVPNCCTPLGAINGSIILINVLWV